jgi:hypothetical protein
LVRPPHWKVYQALDPEASRESTVDGSLGKSWREKGERESHRSPLVRPRHRKVNEPLKTVTAWQSPFDCRLDDVRGEELGLEAPGNERIRLSSFVHLPTDAFHLQRSEHGHAGHDP